MQWPQHQTAEADAAAEAQRAQRRASLYSEQRAYEAGKAQTASSTARFVKRLRDVPYACGAAFTVFACVTVTLCCLKLGDAEASAAYEKQVGKISWPASVHLTSLVLNLKGWLICDNQLKKNFTLLSLYVSFCAMLSYLALCNAGRFRLVVIDAYGAPFLYYRFIQWMFTTPAMFTQMMLLTDQHGHQILATIGFDWLMFITAILGHVVKTKTLATFWLAVSWAAFYFLVVRLDSLFRRAAAAATVLVERATRLSEDMARDQVTAAAANPAKAVAAAAPSAEAAEAAEAEVGLEAFRGSARTTLRMISHAHWLMFIILPTFGLNDVIASTSLAPLSWTENFWGLLDVSAKVLFASALSMTGLVTEDEAEKQRAWLAGQRAVSYSRAAARRSEELQKELKDRTETLSTLCQEGWGLVVRSFMQQGAIPEVVVSATGEAVDPRLPQVPEREPVVAELPPTADGGMGLPHASAAMLTDGGYRSSSEYSRSSDSSATGSSVGGAAHQHMRQRGAKHPQQPRAGSDNGAVAAAEEMANYGAY